MLLLLPPSETKRDGGAEGSRLDLAALSYPQLTGPRRKALASLRALSRNLSAAAAGLKLGPSQRFELDRNRALGSSPLLPALDRYTGVLYDGLDAATLDAGAREFANAHVAIHSALFGLLGGLDPIPAYRLSHDSRLPGLRLKAHWAAPITAVLQQVRPLIVDARSEGYAALGPAPKGSVFLRVVTGTADGTTRALNHFNKKAKGEFARAVLEDRVDAADVDELVAWAQSRGIVLRPGKPGELELVV